MEHVETGTFATSVLRLAKLPKLDHVCAIVVLCLHMSLQWSQCLVNRRSTPPAFVAIICMLFFVTVVPDWMLLVDFMTEFAIISILTGNILPD